MRAFLFYIDDWLSSKKIARMDAAEERGYLRLLLYAASEPDGGLPDDDDELANISLLGPQWWKVSADDSRQFKSQTSGQKLRACFVKKGERLFNERLLREFERQKQVAAKRSAAAKLASDHRRATGSRKPNQSQQRTEEQTDDRTDEQTLTNDVSVCASASASVLDVCPEGLKITLFNTPATPSPGFEAWWSIWSPVRGTNHKPQAAIAWMQVAMPETEQELILCTTSYLASLENPAKGYNPENFLLEQARDGFRARWPPHSRDPVEQRRRRDSEKFRLMVAAEMNEV